MRAWTVWGSLGLLCCLPAAAVWAGESGTALPLELSGALEINQQLGLNKDQRNKYLDYKNLNILDLKAKSVYEGKATAVGEMRIKHTGFDQSRNLDEIGDRTSAEPTQIELKEGYIDYKDFLLEKLDVKVGKQRIAWGTADGINPTDNLNPKNLENPIEFKERLAVNSLKATYYAGPVTVTGVYVPLFVPAVFPSALAPTGKLNSALEGTPLAGRPVTLTETVVLPENDHENSIAAAKAAWKLLDYDMSLSYLYGRDDLPSVTRVSVMPTVTGTVDVEARLQYARMNVVGYDFSGSLGDIGVWGEVAYYMPEKMETETYVMGRPTSVTTVLDEPYTKYVIGGDYTLPEGWYMNVQFVHGFFTEHCHDLRNYVVAQLEKKFFDDVLKVTLKGGLDVTDMQVGSAQNGYMPNLEVSYKPIDNTEVILGAMVLDGPENTTLGQFKDLDQGYVKFKYSF